MQERCQHREMVNTKPFPSKRPAAGAQFPSYFYDASADRLIYRLPWRHFFMTIPFPDNHESGKIEQLKIVSQQ
jgi:hypothetical protein